MSGGRGQLVLLGAGRLAHYLGHQATAAGWRVVQVYARRPSAAQALAEPLGAVGVDQLTELMPGADWYILAVSDDAILPLASALATHFSPSDLRVLHCAGALDLAALQAIWPRAGVLYPLQSFSNIGTVSVAPVPWFWEVAQLRDASALADLAASLSSQVAPLDSAGRLQLHLAAVFANNFSNHCQAIAAALLEKQHLPFDILAPLLRHGLEKALQQGPKAAQTGPALRGDRDTMGRHLALLADHPQWAALYRLLAEDIVHHHHQN